MAEETRKYGLDGRIDHFAEKAAANKQRAGSLLEVLSKLKYKNNISNTIDRAGANTKATSLLSDLVKPIGAMGIIGKKLRNQIPGVSNVVNALKSGNVTDAIPFLDVDSVGPRQGSLEARLESGDQLSPEEYQELQDQSPYNDFARQQREAARKKAIENI